jgi:hypothetical protein
VVYVHLEPAALEFEILGTQLAKSRKAMNGLAREHRRSSRASWWTIASTVSVSGALLRARQQSSRMFSSGNNAFGALETSEVFPNR